MASHSRRFCYENKLCRPSFDIGFQMETMGVLHVEILSGKRQVTIGASYTEAGMADCSDPLSRVVEEAEDADLEHLEKMCPFGGRHHYAGVGVRNGKVH